MSYSYYYRYSPFHGLGNFLMVFGFVLFVALLLCYIWKGWCLQKAFKRINYKHAFFAWVPVLRTFALADASKDEGDTTEFYGFHMPNTAYVLAWIIPLLIFGTFIGKILWCLYLGVMWTKIYAKLDGNSFKNNQILGILSGFFEIIPLIKLSFCYPKGEEKNDKSVDGDDYKGDDEVREETQTDKEEDQEKPNDHFEFDTDNKKDSQ